MVAQTRAMTEKAELKVLIKEATRETVEALINDSQRQVVAAIGAVGHRDAVEDSYPTKLGTFAGTPSENWAKFLARFNRLGQANGWDDNKKRDVLPFYLRGAAEEAYEDISQDNRQTYAGLVDKLGERFSPAKIADLRSIELHNRVQKQDEPVSDFSAEILRLTRSAYPDLTRDHQRGLMKRFFLNGLRPELRRLVMLGNPDTFEAAEKAARAQEASDHFLYGNAPWLNREDSEKNRKCVVRNLDAQSTTRFLPAPVTSSEDKFDLIFKRLNIMEAETRKAREEQMKPLTNSRAHNFSQERKFQPRQFPQASRRTMTSNGRPICHYCRQPGHVQANCFKRLQNQGISNQSYRGRGSSGGGLNPSARPWQPAYRNRNYPQTQDSQYHAACIESSAVGYMGEQNYPRSEAHNAVAPEPINAPYQAFVGAVSSGHSEPSTESYSFETKEEEEGGPIHQPLLPEFRTAGFPFLTALTLLLGLIALFNLPTTLASNVSSEMYNLCGSSRNGHPLALPKQIHCVPPPETGSVLNVWTELWVPRTTLNRISAYRCQLRKRTVCTNVGFFGGRGIVSDTTSSRAVLVSDCKQASLQLAWKDFSLVQVYQSLWTTNNTLQVEFSWCCTDHCYSVENFILEKGEIATVDGQHLTSDLDDVGGCKVENEFCAHAEAIIVWSTNYSHPLCPYEWKGHYRASVGFDHVILDDLQLAFSRTHSTSSPPKCVSLNKLKRAILMDQGVVLNLRPHYNGSLLPLFRYRNASTTSRSKQQELDPVNAKLQYLEMKLGTQINRSFRDLWLELCLLADRQIQFIWQLARIDPTLGVRALLSKDNLHATWAGEALLVFECQQVKPAKIYWNYRVNNTCYEYVPVTFQNQLWFIAPGSRDLVAFSSKVDCNHHMSGMYKDETGWRTAKGPIHVSSVPAEAAYKGFWHPFTFSSPPVFHDKLAGIVSTVGQLKSYVFRVNRLEGQLRVLTNYTASLSLDPSMVREAIAGIGEGIGQALEGAGQAVETVIGGVANGVGSLVNNILSGPLQAIINVAVICAASVFFLLVLYIVFRKYRIYLSKQKKTTDIELAPITEFRSMQPELQQQQQANVHQHQSHIYNMGIYKSPQTDVTVYDIPLRALIDTGSDLTLISQQVYQQIGSVKPPLIPAKTEATSISGHSLNILGKCKVLFSIGSLKFCQEVHVMDQCPHACVLGMDLLCRFSTVMLNNHSGELTLGRLCLSLKTHSPFELYPPGKKLAPSVNLLHTQVVPPHSLALLTGQMSSAPPTSEFMFEPKLSFLAKHDLVGFCGLLPGNTSEVPVQIINPTRLPIKLYKGMALGTVEPVTVCPQSSCNAAGERNACVVPPNLFDQLDLTKSDLTAPQKEELMTFLEANADIFAKDSKDLGRTSLVKHHIDTGDNLPVRQRPYRVPFAQREIINKHVQEMLDQGVIEPSESAYASPVVLVSKKDGSTRFCCDFRKLNAQTSKDIYPLPQVLDILDSLSQAQYFSSLDLASGYWQVEMDPESKPKTAFVTFGGLYEWRVMPFGVTNAPATYQRLMEVALAGLLFKSCFCFIDDILVIGRTFEEHLTHLSEVFQRLRAAGLKLKVKKCHFAQKEVNFLGHIVTKHGVAVDPSKVEKVQKFPAPTDVSTIRQFLGLASYYRRYIAGFSTIASPLNALLKKGVTFTWSFECQTAFDKLKSCLTSAPVLGHPDFSQPFILQTDASGMGLGAILAQKQGDFERVISYASRTLLKNERNYSPIELECLAVIWAVKHFRPYLYGHHFTVYTDHAPLRWLLSIKNPSGRFARWALALQEFDLEILHRSGKSNSNADCLSRTPLLETQTAEANAISASPNTTEESEQTDVSYQLQKEGVLHQHQREDGVCGPMVTYLETGELPEDPQSARKIALGSPRFTLSDGLLYLVDHQSRKGLRLVVPMTLREELLGAYHDDVLAGHLGFLRTWSKLRTLYYWDGMFADVKLYCKRCESCAMRKSPQAKFRAPLVSIPVTGPFDRVACDIVGPLPMSDSGMKWIVVFSEYLTKWVEVFPTADIQATTVARLFVEGIVFRHGAVKMLLTDRGANFTSEVLHNICSILDTRKQFTTAYHPQGDGLVEAFNKTLIKMISHYVCTRQTDWDRWLGACAFAYRTSIHDSTKETPFYLLYGRDAQLPIDVVLEHAPSRYLVDASDYKIELTRHLFHAWETARHCIQKAQAKQKYYYDRTAKEPTFSVGDSVWIHNPAVPKGRVSKLTPHWRGPYRIIETKFPIVLARMCTNPKTSPFWVHVNRLKPCFSHSPPNGIEPSPSDQPNLPHGSDGKHSDSGSSSQQNEQSTDTTQVLLGPVARYNLRPRVK